MPKVLVTSGNTRVSYSICCSLAKHGYDVYIGDRQSFTMAGMSRYCKGRMKYPSPFTEQESFIHSLIQFMKEKDIDVLVPVLEESFTCMKYEHILKEHNISFLLPHYKDALTLHNKNTLTSLASELNIDIPPSMEMVDIVQKNELLANLSTPLIIKPKQGGGGWGMKRFERHEELLNIINQIDKPENYIVQSIVSGQLIGTAAIYYQGTHIASDSYTLTTVYPLRVGQSTTRLTEMHPKALDFTKRLLNHLNWNGLCEIDFIYDKEKDKSYIIDANPRFWGSLKHNIAAGVDYPYYYAQLAKNITTFPIQEAKENTRSRWLGGDILRILAECKESKNPFRSLRKNVFSSIRYEANDDFNFKDPIPFFTWCINLMLNKVINRKKDALPGVWK